MAKNMNHEKKIIGNLPNDFDKFWKIMRKTLEISLTILTKFMNHFEKIIGSFDKKYEWLSEIIEKFPYDFDKNYEWLKENQNSSKWFLKAVEKITVNS